MDLNLKGRAIVVTGGAKGIGAAIVHACAQEGAIPVTLDRDNVAVQQLHLELHRQGVTHEAITVELTDSANTCRAIEDVGRKLGHLDGLVNNAGVNDGVGLETGSPERFAASLHCNLTHYYTVAHALLPFLKRSKGPIVNIASKVAVTGQGGTSGYAASKGAILALTREWAVELSPYGIRTNAVIPSEVLTPQYQNWVQQYDDPQEQLRRIASKVPLGRRMTAPDEIAAMVLFLLSAKSANITGQHLFVDGGYVHLDRALT